MIAVSKVSLKVMKKTVVPSFSHDGRPSTALNATYQERRIRPAFWQTVCVWPLKTTFVLEETVKMSSEF